MYCELRTLTALCGKCQTTLDDFAKSSKRNLTCAYKVTTVQLYDTAEDGCDLCIRAWHEACRKWEGYHHGPISLRLEESDRGSPSSDSASGLYPSADGLAEIAIVLDVSCRRTFSGRGGLEIIYVSPPMYNVTFSLIFSVADKHMHSAFKPGSTITQDDAYGAIVAQTSRWLKEDIAFHQEIDGEDSSPTWCPKRLIEILDSNGELIRIVHTESWDHGAEYATLSYRWPNVNFLRATKSNMSLLQSEDGFATSRLLPIFQDAVRLVRRLGMKYAWIDSLCIMQDDPDDWAMEAPKMSEVYSNTQLTVTFNGDPLSSEAPIELLARNIAASISASFTPYFVDGEDGDFLEYVSSYLSSSPLASRGWCYQERMLSKRLIHFFPATCIWERIGQEPHRYQTLREPHRDFSLATPGHARIGTREEEYKEELLDVVLGCTKGDRDPALLTQGPRSADLIASWLSSVEEYTRRDLTHKEDRMIAFSAVARKFEEYMGDSYVLGCFAGCLLQCLCWSVNKSQKECRRTRLNAEVCRIPSWSWATVDGEICYSSKLNLAAREHEIAADMALLGFYQTPSGDELGTWKDTKAIQVYGLLLPARVSSLHKSADADVGFATFNDDMALRVFGFPTADVSTSWVRTYQFRFDSSTESADGYQKSLFLPLHTNPYVVGNPKKNPAGSTLTILFSCEGLLLTKSSRYPDAYERYACANHHKRITIREAGDFDLRDACARYQRALQERKLEAGVDFLLV